MTVNKRSFKTRSGRYNLHTCPDSPFFQAYLLPNNHKSWMRLSTGTDDFDEAKDIAIENLVELKTNLRNGFPIGTRNFPSVAEITIQALRIAKERGVRLGNLNLGTDNRKRRQRADLFAEGLRGTIEAFKSQGYSQERIIEELNGMGALAPQEGPWVSCTQIRNVLKRLNRA